MNIQINEIRGLADAFAATQSKKNNWSSTLDNQIRKTCNEVCDKNGFVDEDAQPDVSEFEQFKSWMEDMINISDTDPSVFRPIDFSISINDIADSDKITIMGIISGFCKSAFILNNQSINFKIGLIEWVYVYRYMVNTFQKETAFRDIIEEAADKLEIANSYFTRDFFTEVHL